MALTRQQKLDLERIIRERRAQLATELMRDAAKVRDEAYGEIGGAPPGDRGDEASADVLSDIDQAELSRDVMELRELDHALARLTGREVGRCLDCGQDIAFERLVASPAAIRCVDCQRLHEKLFAPRRPTSL